MTEKTSTEKKDAQATALSDKEADKVVGGVKPKTIYDRGSGPKFE